MSPFGMNYFTPVTVMMFLVFGFVSNPALAHSFNVALVLPTPSAQEEQFHMGFMLATTQRDSHPDETSDGHLGGLDVYVIVVQVLEAVADDIDIVVVAASQQAFDTLTAVQLRLGQTPFAHSDQPGVARFISAYKAAYGMAPTVDAAQGYNAAQRIEVAVRDQSGVDDKALLVRSFKESARTFTW